MKNSELKLKSDYVGGPHRVSLPGKENNKKTESDFLKLIKFTLRVSLFVVFTQKGIEAFYVNESWISLITAFGFNNNFAEQIMPLIGIMNIVVAIGLMVYFNKTIIMFAILWTLLVMLSIIISGGKVVCFYEGFFNCISPLLLYVLYYSKEFNSEV